MGCASNPNADHLSIITWNQPFEILSAHSAVCYA